MNSGPFGEDTVDIEAEESSVSEGQSGEQLHLWTFCTATQSSCSANSRHWPFHLTCSTCLFNKDRWPTVGWYQQNSYLCQCPLSPTPKSQPKKIQFNKDALNTCWKQDSKLNVKGYKYEKPEHSLQGTCINKWGVQFTAPCTALIAVQYETKNITHESAALVPVLESFSAAS